MLLAPSSWRQAEEELLALVPRLLAARLRLLLWPGGGDLDRELVLLGARPVAFWTLGAALRWPLRRVLERRLRRAGVELVHVRAERALFALSRLFQGRGVRLVWSCGREPDWEPPARSGRSRESADLVLVPSRYGWERLLDWAPHLEPRLRLLRPGVDLERFDPEAALGMRIARLAERWQVGPDRRVVILQGPLRPGWGHLAAVEALARLARPGLLLVCLSAGEADAAFARRVERAARRAGVADQVRFMALPGDRAAAYALAELVLWLAPAQAFDAPPLLEAQAMGRLVVGRGSGCASEFLEEEATGWLWHSGRGEELAAILSQALALEPDLRAQLARRARRFVARHYPQARRIQGLLAVYRSLLGPRGPDLTAYAASA